METQFKPGDRVAVYNYLSRKTGTVDSIDVTKDSNGECPAGTPVVLVVFDGNSRISHVLRPQQCRRLTNRVRRSVWINPNPTPNGNAFEFLPQNNFVSYDHGPPGWIEFGEVKK